MSSNKARNTELQYEIAILKVKFEQLEKRFELLEKTLTFMERSQRAELKNIIDRNNVNSHQNDETSSSDESIEEKEDNDLTKPLIAPTYLYRTIL